MTERIVLYEDDPRVGTGENPPTVDITGSRITDVTIGQRLGLGEGRYCVLPNGFRGEVVLEEKRRARRKQNVQSVEGTASAGQPDADQ
jgi:hypothetical protein